MNRPRSRRSPVTLLLAALALTAAPLALATPPAIEVQRVGATGSMPKGVCISPDGHRLYVANYGQRDHNNVSIFDADTMALAGHIDVPGIVVESAVSPDGRTLYVSNFTRNSVQFIDLATSAVTREVTAGQHPKIVVLSRDGRRLFAANWASRNVTEIDTSTGAVVRTLAAEENPRGMAITSAGRLYVANSTSDSVEIYEGAQMETHRRLQHVCRIPRHLSLSPDDSRLYVSCLGAGTVEVLDTATNHHVHTVYVASGPKSNAVSPDGRYVAAADYNASSVTLIDTTDWSRREIEVPTMDRASGIVFAHDGVRFFVTGWFDDHLYEIGVHGAAPRFHPTPREIARTLESRQYHNGRSGE
jgi:YVTN family beta-propeller protein